MRPDLITPWPIHVDYPLWRQQLKKIRGHFDKVIIVFTQMNAEGDYREFIKDSLAGDDCIIVDSNNLKPGEDWRNVATNTGLEYSQSDWVFFTEEDFFINDMDRFWELVNSLVDAGVKAIGYFQSGDRFHPCCLFVERETINATQRDFGVRPDVSDHFSIFTQDLLNNKVPVGYITEPMRMSIFYHLNGLSQNIYLLQSGEVPNYDPPSFKKYMEDCLLVSPIHEDFIKMAKEYLHE